MTDQSITATDETGPIPAYDPGCAPTLSDPDDPGLPPVSLAGGTCTILGSGAQTQGRLRLIDRLVPDGGGPSPLSGTTSRRRSR